MLVKVIYQKIATLGWFSTSTVKVVKKFNIVVLKYLFLLQTQCIEKLLVDDKWKRNVDFLTRSGEKNSTFSDGPFCSPPLLIQQIKSFAFLYVTLISIRAPHHKVQWADFHKCRPVMKSVSQMMLD